MPRRLSSLCVAILFGATLAAPAPAVDRDRFAALERIATKLSGLRPKQPLRSTVENAAAFDRRATRLRASLYANTAAQHDKLVYRILGLTAGRTRVENPVAALEPASAAYVPSAVRTYIRGENARRSAILRSFVYALQDQHFGHRRFLRIDDHDARQAAAAAIEGHATLTVEILGGLRTPTVRSRRREPLDAFLDLERGFASATGGRFAVRLRNLGGNRAVHGALRRYPETTEQVFHLDKFLEREQPKPIILPVDPPGYSLVSDSTWGELDVRALLAVFGIPRLQQVATGWGGGRIGLYSSGSTGYALVVALDWDSDVDAAEWQEAVTVYVNEAFDAARPGFPAPVSCAATRCWSVGDRRIAFVREAGRTALAFAASQDDAAGLARATVPAAG